MLSLSSSGSALFPLQLMMLKRVLPLGRGGRGCGGKWLTKGSRTKPVDEIDQFELEQHFASVRPCLFCIEEQNDELLRRLTLEWLINLIWPLSSVKLGYWTGMIYLMGGLISAALLVTSPFSRGFSDSPFLPLFLICSSEFPLKRISSLSAKENFFSFFAAAKVLQERRKLSAKLIAASFNLYCQLTPLMLSFYCH